MKLQVILPLTLLLTCSFSLGGCQFLPHGDQLTWDKMLETAEAARAKGDFETAEKNYQMAIDDGLKDHPDDLTVAIAASKYAAMEVQRKKLPDAERLYKQSLASYLKHFSPIADPVKQVRAELCAVLTKEGKGKEAKQLQAEANPNPDAKADKENEKPAPHRHGHRKR